MPDERDKIVELYAKTVVEFSSQYDDRYAAEKILGQPTVYPKYGDYKGTWAQKTLSANEFIVLEFEEKLFLTAVEVYEVYNSGGVFRVSAFDDLSGKWVKLWETKKAARLEISRAFSPPFAELAFKSNRIRLDVDCTIANSWCEFDAVKIKGKENSSNKPEVSELAANLKDFVNNPLFSDVTFLISSDESKEVEVVAHKAILASRSGYFNALLSGADFGSDKSIRLDGVSYAGFQALLHYIYTNDIDPSLPTQVVTELIRIGDRISLNHMKNLGQQYLSENLTPDNVIDIYINAAEKLPRLDDIEALALDFAAKHLTKVTQTTSFTGLNRETMLVVVQESAARLHLD